MSCHIFHFSDSLSAKCAETVVDDFADRLPDLSAAIILLPDALRKVKAQSVELRSRLLDCAKQKGCDALIPPMITTPRGLFIRRCLANQMTETTRRRGQLVLAHALTEHAGLFPNQSPWQSSASLLNLFNEISELSGDSEYDSAALEQGLLGLEGDIWNDDTKMFLALWRVWEELTAGNDDYGSRRLERKAFIDNQLISEEEHVYLCGLDNLTPSQTRWAKDLHAKGRLSLLIQDTDHPLRYPNPAFQMATAVCGGDCKPPEAKEDFSRFIDEVFSNNTEPLRDRVEKFAAAVKHSPVDERLDIFLPSSFEQHAWGIYLKVKKWIEQGHEKISIVCLDRKLSRRMRAAFNRYGIILQDYSGWELSTTSVAAALHKLIPDEKGQFDCTTLITLMRSPFFSLGITSNQRIRAVNKLETHLAKLPQLPRTPHELLSTLSDDDGSGAIDIGQQIISLLDKMQALVTHDKQVLTHYFDTLFEVLEETGMRKRLWVDDAGKKLFGVLSNMKGVAAQEQLEGSFYFWRAWLMYSLEHDNYAPPLSERGILLMSAEQARLWRPDALVFAALEDRHLPALHTSLMNEKIRSELGLETQEQKTAREFLLFRTLLESAPRVLLTCQQQSGNQALTPSAWLKALQDFHQLAYRDDLVDRALAKDALHCHIDAKRESIGREPQPQLMPAPRASRNLWPKQISASAYQTMVDCPYQFFARYCLGLKTRQYPDEYWSKTEFGIRMHASLQALLTKFSEHPDLMADKRDKQNIARMRAIADEVIEKEFREAVSKNYANTYWLSLAKKMSAAYIDWFSRQSCTAVEPESKKDKRLGKGLMLKGKFDLMMEDGGKKTVIDYKTGMVPAVNDVKHGEKVQLTCYALLDEDIEEAFYLALKESGRKMKKVQIKDDDLESYRRMTRERLEQIHSDYVKGSALPAWGNEKTVCQNCDWKGLCRRPVWQSLGQQQNNLHKAPHDENEQSRQN